MAADPNYQAYADVWVAVLQYLNQKKLETRELPPTSPERLMVAALLGQLWEHEPEVGQPVSDSIEGLITGFQELTGDSDTELSHYIAQTVDGLRRVQIQVTGSENPLEDELDDLDEPEPEEDEPDAPAPEPEEPKSDREELAQRLGLGQGPQESRGLRLVSLLREADDFKPGTTVFRTYGGKLQRRQVVRDEGGRVRVVDPESDDRPEEVSKDELATSDEEGEQA